NARLRNVESVITLFKPSALQKRDIANGRSAETTRTTVLRAPLAFSLNTRVELAQVGVSRLGTIFSTLRCAANSTSASSFRSLLVRLKSGAVAPLPGSVPATLNGFPLRVTLAMWLLLSPKGRKCAVHAKWTAARLCA